MKLVMASVLILFILLGCLQQNENKDYFPLKVNSYWMYDTDISGESGKQSGVVKFEITNTEIINGRENYVMTSYFNGVKSQEEFYYRDGDKIMASKRILQNIVYELDPDQLFYDFGSQSWSWQGKISSMKCKSDGTLIGEEKITVPAGDFNTLKTKLVVTCDGSVATIYRWFADKVGAVKEISTITSPIRLEVVGELKEYKIG